jgi:hypothetical protein
MRFSSNKNQIWEIIFLAVENINDNIGKLFQRMRVKQISFVLLEKKNIIFPVRYFFLSLLDQTNDVGTEIV